MAVIGSDRFCKILLVSKSDWQPLSNVEPVDLVGGLWVGGMED